MSGRVERPGPDQPRYSAHPTYLSTTELGHALRATKQLDTALDIQRKPQRKIHHAADDRDSRPNGQQAVVDAVAENAVREQLVRDAHQFTSEQVHESSEVRLNRNQGVDVLLARERVGQPYKILARH